MNRLQKLILGKKYASLLTRIENTPFGLGRFVEVGGQLTWMADKASAYVVDGFQANDIIYSAVMLIMDKVRLAPWGLYKVVDESSLNKMHSLLRGAMTGDKFNEVKRLRKKAIEPIENLNRETGRIAELIKWPNEYCTFNDLVADATGFQLITGNEFMYGDQLTEGANKGTPSELWNAPAQYMLIKATRSWPQRIVGYQLNQGEIRDFTKEQIMHIKFWNPAYGISGEGLYGQSPIRAASRTVTRNNAAKQAGAVQLSNNGAAGIAYVDDDKITAAQGQAQAAAVKKVWNTEYAGADNFNKVAFSGIRMGYVSVGMSLKEMALTDVEAVDMRRLANIWGIPSQLLNDPDNKSYNNQKEAEKALTSRCAMPRLSAFRNNFNRKLKTDWGFKDKNVYVDYDISVYTELQEDQAEKWGWVSKLPVSSGYKLDLMGLDIPDDPNMDVILVEGNLVPLSDVVNQLSEDEMRRIDDDLNKAGLTDYLRVAK